MVNSHVRVKSYLVQPLFLTRIMWYIFDTIFRSGPCLQMVKWEIILESFLVQLYFIPINRYVTIIRLSELAHTAWKGDGPLHFDCIWSNVILCWVYECLIKRDWSSTLQAESIRTSLQRLEIGILSVLAHESCVCWGWRSQGQTI